MGLSIRALHVRSVGGDPFFLSPTLGPYFLVALILSPDLFVHARDLLDGAKPPGLGQCSSHGKACCQAICHSWQGLL